tara:strand:- start:133 stop:339 length:207 start_codon:yes stop_codon:yes gene_type:complete
MLEVNPKKFKKIQNKTIPSPLRPKFRNKNQTNMYFLSKGNNEKNKVITLMAIICGIGILFSLFFYFKN